MNDANDAAALELIAIMRSCPGDEVGAAAMAKALAVKFIASHTRDSYGSIADQLNNAGVPTLSGRGAWGRSSVYRLAAEAGIKAGYAA